MPADLAAKPAFANGALRFVNRASRRVRSLVLVVAGSLVAAIAGPFGTVIMPFMPRAGFWLAVCLWNFAKWEVWFAILSRRGWHWRTIMLAGFPVLLLPLPLEVDLGLRVFAGTPAFDHLGIWVRGAAMGGLWVLIVLLLQRPDPKSPAARFPGTAIRLAEIAALTAEDHYVRLHLADGSERLLHARFADAVAAMDGVVGAQLSRGGWVADTFRGPADYRGRRWFVRAGQDLWLPVSRGRVAELRELGWLARAS